MNKERIAKLLDIASKRVVERQDEKFKRIASALRKMTVTYRNAGDKGE